MTGLSGDAWPEDGLSALFPPEDGLSALFPPEDGLSALFPRIGPEEAAWYAECLGRGEGPAWGVWARAKNLNVQGEDPFRPEDAPPVPAVEVGLKFRF